MFSPGAAMPTHGPAMVKSEGCPPGASEPTDSTYGCHHDGMDTDVTPAQLRGSSGRPGSDSGLDAQADPAFDPAAVVACGGDDHRVFLDRRVPQRRAEFGLVDGLVGGQAGDRRDVDDPGAEVRGADDGARQRRDVQRAARGGRVLARVARREPRRGLADRQQPGAAGATPENPSAPGWPAMRPATSVPCPSQSVRPSVDSTKSPPGSTLGSRGPGRTPVSMTATSLAFAAAVLPGPGQVERNWFGLTAPGIAAGQHAGGDTRAALRHRLHGAGGARRRRARRGRPAAG